MADEFDIASALEEQQRQQALDRHRAAMADRRLAVTGQCHNCGEHLPAGGLFCDADCSADHELRTRRR